MSISFICTPPQDDTIDICCTIKLFIYMILKYDKIINTKNNIKIYSNYDIHLDDILTSTNEEVNIFNKTTKKTTKHLYLILGDYNTETETWHWHKRYHKFIKSQINDLHKTHCLYTGIVKKIVDKMLAPIVRIHKNDHYIIPYFIQILLSKTTLQRFDLTDNTGFVYVLIADFGKKYGYTLNINYETFMDEMSIVNILNATRPDNDNKKAKKLSRNINNTQYTITNVKTHNISNGLEHDFNFTYDTGTSKFKFNSAFKSKISRAKTTLNTELIRWFELLIKQLVFYVDVKTGKDKLAYSYKVNAIKKALNILKSVDFKIKNGKQLQKYKGIGTGTINRIDEILETGGLLEVNEADISGKHLEYVDELMQIFGIGRVKAYELYTKHDIKSVTELKQAINNKNIELPENILKGIKYVDKIKTNIPHSEVDEIVSYLITTGIKYDPNIEIRICGSFRRETKTSNDIDIIISHPDIITKQQAEKSDIMKKFITHLINSKFIVDSLTSLKVPTKYMGICRLSPKHKIRRIDIRFIPQESYYTAILYFTGSREFNRKMRSVALSMGYTLNEYRLLDDKGKAFKVNSEKDIFDLLNMEYVQPQYRK